MSGNGSEASSPMAPNAHRIVSLGNQAQIASRPNISSIISRPLSSALSIRPDAIAKLSACSVSPLSTGDAQYNHIMRAQTASSAHRPNSTSEPGNRSNLLYAGASLLPLLSQNSSITVKRSATQSLPPARQPDPRFPQPPRRKHTARSRHITSEAGRYTASRPTQPESTGSHLSMFSAPCSSTLPASLDGVTSATTVTALTTRTSLRPNDYAPTDTELITGTAYRVSAGPTGTPSPTQLPSPLASVPVPLGDTTRLVPLPVFATAALTAYASPLHPPAEAHAQERAAIHTQEHIPAPASQSVQREHSYAMNGTMSPSTATTSSTPQPSLLASASPQRPLSPPSVVVTTDSTLLHAQTDEELPSLPVGEDITAAKALFGLTSQVVCEGVEQVRAHVADMFAQPVLKPPARPQSLSQAVDALQERMARGAERAEGPRRRGIGALTEDSILFKTTTNALGRPTSFPPTGTQSLSSQFTGSQMLSPGVGPSRPGTAPDAGSLTHSTSPFCSTSTALAADTSPGATAHPPRPVGGSPAPTRVLLTAAPASAPALTTSAVPLTSLTSPTLGVLANKVARRVRSDNQQQFQLERQRLETEIASLRRFLGTHVSVSGAPLAHHSLRVMATQLAELREVAATVIVRLEKTEMDKLQLQQQLHRLDAECEEVREHNEQLQHIATTQHQQLERLQERCVTVEQERTRLLAVVQDAVAVVKGQERKQASEARALQETQHEYERALSRVTEELQRTKLALHSQETTGSKLREYVQDIGHALSESQMHAKELIHSQAEASSLRLQIREREREEGEGQRLQAGLLKAAEELGRRVAEAERDSEMVEMQRKKEKRATEDLQREVQQLQGTVAHVKSLYDTSQTAHANAVAQLQEELAAVTARAVKSEHELQLLRSNKYVSDSDKQRQLREKEDVSRKTQEELLVLQDALAQEQKLRKNAEKDRSEMLLKCQQLQKLVAEFQIEAASAREMSKAAREREELVQRELEAHRAIARDANTALSKTSQEEGWLRSALESKNRELQSLRTQLDAAMGNHSTATRSLVQAQAQNMLDMHELSSLRPLRAMLEQAIMRAKETEQQLVEERAKLAVLKGEFGKCDEERKKAKEEAMVLRLKYHAQLAIRDEFQAKMRGEGESSEKTGTLDPENFPRGLLSGMGYYDMVDHHDTIETASLDDDISEDGGGDDAAAGDNDNNAGTDVSSIPSPAARGAKGAEDSLMVRETASPFPYSRPSSGSAPPPLALLPSVSPTASEHGGNTSGGGLFPLSPANERSTGSSSSLVNNTPEVDGAATPVVEEMPGSSRRLRPKKPTQQLSNRPPFNKKQSFQNIRRSAHGSPSTFSPTPSSPQPNAHASPTFAFLLRGGSVSSSRPTSATYTPTAQSSASTLNQGAVGGSRPSSAVVEPINASSRPPSGKQMVSDQVEPVDDSAIQPVLDSNVSEEIVIATPEVGDSSASDESIETAEAATERVAVVSIQASTEVLAHSEVPTDAVSLVSIAAEEAKDDVTANETVSPVASQDEKYFSAVNIEDPVANKTLPLKELLEDIKHAALDYEIRYNDTHERPELDHDITALLNAIREHGAGKDAEDVPEVKETEQEEEENPFEAADFLTNIAENAHVMTSYDLSELRNIAVSHAIRYMAHSKQHKKVDSRFARELRSTAMKHGLRYVQAHLHVRQANPALLAEISQLKKEDEHVVVGNDFEQFPEVVTVDGTVAAAAEVPALDNAPKSILDSMVEEVDYSDILATHLPACEIIPPAAAENDPIRSDLQVLDDLVYGLRVKGVALGVHADDDAIIASVKESENVVLAGAEGLVATLTKAVNNAPFSQELADAVVSAKGMASSFKTYTTAVTDLAARHEVMRDDARAAGVAAKECADYVLQNASMRAHIDSLQTQIAAAQTTVEAAQTLALALLSENHRLQREVEERDRLLAEARAESEKQRVEMAKALERTVDDRLARAVLVVRERLRLEAVDLEICEAIRVVRLQILNKKAELDELRGRGGKQRRQVYYDNASELVQVMEKLLVKKAAIVKALAKVRRDEDAVDADVAMLFKDTPELCPRKFLAYLNTYDNGLHHKGAIVAETQAELEALESGVRENLDDEFQGVVPGCVLAAFAEEDEEATAAAEAADASVKRMAALSTKDWMEGGEGCVTGMGTASGKGGPNSHPTVSVLDAVTAYGQENEDLDAHFAVYDSNNANNGAVLGNADDVMDDRVDRSWLPLRSQIVDVVASNTVLSTHLIVAEEEKESVRKAHNKIISTLNTTRAQNRLLRVYAGPDAVKVCEDEAEREVARIVPTYKTVSGLYLSADVNYDVNNVWADGIQWDSVHDNGHYVYTGIDEKESTSLLAQNMQHIVSSIHTAPVTPRAQTDDTVEVGDKYIATLTPRTTTPHRTRDDPFASPRSLSRSGRSREPSTPSASMEFGTVPGSFARTPSRGDRTPRSQFTTPHPIPTTPRGAPPTTPRGARSRSASRAVATTPRGSALSSHAIFNTTSVAASSAPVPPPAARETTTPKRQRQVTPLSPTSRLLVPKTPTSSAPSTTRMPTRTPTTSLRHTRTTVATASAASTPKAGNSSGSFGSSVRSPSTASRGRIPKTASITSNFVTSGRR